MGFLKQKILNIYYQYVKKVKHNSTFSLRDIYLLFVVFLIGCAPQRDLVYFSNLDSDDVNETQVIENVVIPTIQPDDLLSIQVISLSAESNMLFNQGVVGSLGSTVSDANRMQSRTSSEGYLVDKDGYINFPVIGKIHLGGLTKDAATDTIENILDREYVKDPTVNIRFLNFKITLIGEVNTPSTVTILTEKVNIMEAISLAGDLTAIGKRENVLIIREKDGKRHLIRVDLNDKNLLNSPDYYLQQNDILYVEPDRNKQVGVNTNSKVDQWIKYGGVGLGLLTLIFSLTRK